MKTDHTPEPWRAGTELMCVGELMLSSDCHPLYDADGLLIGITFDENDARRIVACVNACAGIPDEQLEMDISIGGELAIYDSMKSEIECLREWQSTVRNSSPLLMRAELAEKQRDELLAAAEAIEIAAEECLDFDECTAMLVPIDTYRKLMEAIARAKGEQ